MDTPDEALAAAVAARRERDGLERRIEEVEKALALAEQQAASSDERAAGEQRDVDRLESLSWSRIASALRGSRLSDLDRERAEAQQAQYEAATARAGVERERAEVAGLRSRLRELGSVDQDYQDALAAKERWLQETPGPATRRLAEIAERRGHLSAEHHELTEAYNAGVTAHNALADAARLLADARTWSAWDTFGGGGLLTDMAKYSKLDGVNRDLDTADRALKLFTRELADVHLPAVEALDIGSLTTTLDIWFDNIFSDWAVRDRIIKAQAAVTAAVARVDDTLHSLDTRRTEVTTEHTTLSQERRDLLGG